MIARLCRLIHNSRPRYWRPLMRVDLSSLEFEIAPAWEIKIAGMDRPVPNVFCVPWVSGIPVTHHRQAGRQLISDRPGASFPFRTYQQEPLPDAEAYHRWIIARRYQAVGLLRPNAEACIWSGVGIVARNLAITQLVEMGTLTLCTSAKRNGYTIYSPNSYPIP